MQEGECPPSCSRALRAIALWLEVRRFQSVAIRFGNDDGGELRGRGHQQIRALPQRGRRSARHPPAAGGEQDEEGRQEEAVYVVARQRRQDEKQDWKNGRHPRHLRPEKTDRRPHEYDRKEGR